MPTIGCLYKISPMGLPSDTNKAIIGKAVIHVIIIAFDTLSLISCQLFKARFSERLGIITTDNAPVMVKGRKSNGITIPNIIPNRPIASSRSIPLAISLCGINIELVADIKEETRRVIVIGIAIVIMLPNTLGNVL